MMHEFVEGIFWRVYSGSIKKNDLRIPLVANIDAGVITDKQEVERALRKQMRSPVQWWPSMQNLADCDVIIQVGPGQAYTKMLKREWPDKEIISINTQEDIETLLPLLGKTIESACHEEDCNTELCAKKDIVVHTDLFDDDFMDFDADSDGDSASLS